MTTSDHTTDEQFERNLDLFHQHMTDILDDPTIIEHLPDGAAVIFLPEDDPTLTERNIEMGLEVVRRGENVYFYHIRAGVPAS